MIKCIFDPNYNFNTISCDEGEYITSYTDDKDIKEFSSFTIAYCPANTDISIYRIITEEENLRYLEKKQETEKLENNE